MKNNMYILDYSTKGKFYSEIVGTFELIIFLILAKFNKKVEVYNIKYNHFLSNDNN